jgi:hypothetical protein
MADGMVEWSNGGNGQMAGMAGMAERQKEWQNGKMAEVATYVLFMVHADTNDNNTLIFYSIDSKPTQQLGWEISSEFRGNPFGIPRNSAFNPILDLFNCGIFIGILFFQS